MLDCGLEIVSLDANPRYEAISYCWGEVSGSEVIRLNGVESKAPASATKVLRQFRPTYSFRTFWIDALCMNQADVEERSSQVSIMDQVYRNTEKCLIWLGDEDRMAEPVLRALKAIADEYYAQLHEAIDGFSEEVPGDFKYTTDYFETLFKDCTARGNRGILRATVV